MATDGDKIAAAIIATGLANRKANSKSLQDTYVEIYEQVLARISGSEGTKDKPAPSTSARPERQKVDTKSLGKHLAQGGTAVEDPPRKKVATKTRGLGRKTVPSPYMK